MRMRESAEDKMAMFQTTKSSYVLADPRNKKREEERKKRAAEAQNEKNSQMGKAVGADTGGKQATNTEKNQLTEGLILENQRIPGGIEPSVNINSFRDLLELQKSAADTSGGKTGQNTAGTTEAPNTTKENGEKTEMTRGQTDTQPKAEETGGDTKQPTKEVLAPVFSTDVTPVGRTPIQNVYESAYAEEIDRLLRELAGREPFSYDYESDPLYSAYKKQYLREADRTAEDTLGYYAGMTGGMPSTAAISAASEASNAYKSALSDKIPELMQLAYDMYLDEIAQSRYDLDTLRELDNTAYNRWYTANRDAVEDARYEDETSYNRWYRENRDAIEDARYEDETELVKAAADAEEAEALLDEWKKGETVLTEEQAEKIGYPPGIPYDEYELRNERYAAASDMLAEYLFAKNTLGTAASNAIKGDMFQVFNEIYEICDGDAEEFERAMEQLVGEDPDLSELYVEWFEKQGDMLT